ncbi:MAG: M3 family metallopeptidase [Pseudomonadota bacterium]
MQKPIVLAAACALALAACSKPAPESTPVTPTDAPTAAAAAPTANPFFVPSTLPLLAPDFTRIRDEHYLPAFEEGMKRHLAEVRAIADNPEPASLDNTLAAMERSGDLLYRVSQVFFNLTGSHTSETLQKIEAEVAPKLASHQDAIFLDPKLFARVKALYDARDALAAHPEDRRLAERYYHLFVRAGALLDDAGKAKMRALNEELSTLQTAFGENLLKEVNDAAVVFDSAEALAGLSEAQLSAAAAAAKERGLEGKWVVALQNTTGQPVLASLTNRESRQRVFEASVNRGIRGNAFDQRERIRRIATLRAERAALLGFPNLAAYALDDQMAKTPAAVDKMLNDLVPAVMANVRREAAEIQARIKADGGDFELAGWDWAYYAEKVRQAKYDLDEAQVRPYFELERVLNDGLFFAMEKLYGITLKERSDIPTYHPDVRVFDVFDADGSQLGLFYADLYARPSKRGGAWMNTFVDQSHLLGTKPVVLNNMNIPKPADGQPTLLSFDEVTTLFHEFGHAIHGLFSNTRYPLIGGTSVPRDFVEFPSQANEDWALLPEVLANYAKHYQTGEPIPADLLKKIVDANQFGQGFATLEYIAAAMLDQDWHQLDPASIPADPVAFEAQSLKARGVDYAPIPPRYRTGYFAHIWPGGYSAGYYAYLWSEVMAADAFAHQMATGGMTRAVGDAYRAGILSRGGTVEGMDMYRAWRGGEPSVEALLVRRGIKQ